jgi:NADH-quinone oxidoreductase subunit L
LAGALLTPLYIFRAVWLTFYGKYRGEHDIDHVKESPWVVTLPLVLLAIPSVIAGFMLAAPMLYDTPRLLGNSILVLPQHDIYSEMVHAWPGAWQAALAAIHTATFWLVIVGVVLSWLITLRLPRSGEFFKTRFRFIAWIIDNKYGFDAFNQHVLARGTRALGRFFYLISDLVLIDGVFVNGSGRGIRWLARVSRRLQTGHLYHYAFAMVAGLAILLLWLLPGF